MKKLLKTLVFVLLASLCIVGCSKDDFDNDEGGGKSKGSVKITSITRGSKNNGKYTYKVTVKASGVSASEVKDIGVTWGKTSAANQYSSGIGGKTTTTRSPILHSNSTYYFRPFLTTTTSGGRIYGSKERVVVPK